VIEVDIFLNTGINIPMNPDSVYRHIGAVIRDRRKKFKPRWTQEKLAKRVGISRASLANIETGRQSVLVHQLYAFAEVLELSPSDFLLPANDANARAGWEEVLPDDLRPQQKDQIARLLATTQAERSPEKEVARAKQNKR
jgi:transcriptional regulator with XRE-family HTH domain